MRFETAPGLQAQVDFATCQVARIEASRVCPGA